MKNYEATLAEQLKKDRAAWQNSQVSLDAMLKQVSDVNELGALKRLAEKRERTNQYTVGKQIIMAVAAITTVVGLLMPIVKEMKSSAHETLIIAGMVAITLVLYSLLALKAAHREADNSLLKDAIQARLDAIHEQQSSGQAKTSHSGTKSRGSRNI